VTFVNIGSKLYRIIAVHYLFPRPYFMFLSKSGIPRGGYLDTGWKTHTELTNELLTLALGCNYPFPNQLVPCKEGCTDWIEDDGEITRGISEAILATMEAIKK